MRSILEDSVILTDGEPGFCAAPEEDQTNNLLYDRTVFVRTDRQTDIHAQSRERLNSDYSQNLK